MIGDSPVHLVQHWIATRAGYAAPSWHGHARYAFGARVFPQNDNGHFYLQTLFANDTGKLHKRSVQPTFPAASGNTVLVGAVSGESPGYQLGSLSPTAVVHLKRVITGLHKAVQGR